LNDYLALKAALDGFAGLYALIGTRSFQGIMPSGTPLPAVTYSRVSGGEELGAESNPGICHARIQVTAFGNTALEANQVAMQVKLALDRMRNVMVGGVVVDDCFWQGFGPDIVDPDTRIPSVPADYVIHYRE
jgi:hypothetical protein